MSDGYIAVAYNGERPFAMVMAPINPFGQKVEFPFHKDMAVAIHVREKTESTRREPKGEPGDWFELEEFGETFLIVAVRAHTFGWIFHNRYHQEGFPSEQAFRDYYHAIGRGHDVDDKDIGFIHTFEPVDPDLMDAWGSMKPKRKKVKAIAEATRPIIVPMGTAVQNAADMKVEVGECNTINVPDLMAAQQSGKKVSVSLKDKSSELEGKLPRKTKQKNLGE